MSTALQELGIQGELVAAKYLKSKGWEILDHRYRAGHRDIDLIAAKVNGGERIIAFVEVKTRGSNEHGGPIGAITWQKKKEISQAAAAWLKANRRRLCGRDDSFRFDVVGVIIARGKTPRGPKVWHIQDAFWVNE